MEPDLGGAKAVKDAGLNPIVFGGQDNASGLDLIDRGLVAAAPAAYSPQWVGWAALDTLNRSFNGEEPVPEGIGYTLVDDGHNQPSGG